MPIPKPSQGESQNDFISSCMSNEVMNDEYPDKDQRMAICSSQWRERSVDINTKLLDGIRTRLQGRKKTEFGYGILTADRYVRTLLDCVGLETCYKFAHKGSTSFNDVLEKSHRTLVYSNPDMVIEEKRPGGKIPLPDGVEMPKNVLVVFRHVLSTPRKDRDGDILRSEGAEVDPKMLLLWQHVHTLPIGKMLAIHEQTKDRLSLYSAIVDMNELCHDAAVMVDNDMARFSHGFRALEFDKIKGENAESPGSFDVKKWEAMEESLVSVPSNIDAATEEVMLSLVEGGKMTSELMKRFGKSLRDKRPKQVSGVEIRFSERLGDYDRELVCGSFSELKKAYDAGLVGVKEEGDEDEDESGSGGDASEGAGEEKQDDASSSKETNDLSVRGEEAGQTSDEEVKYAPGQPRDDSGRFSPSGGSGGSVGGGGGISDSGGGGGSEVAQSSEAAVKAVSKATSGLKKLEGDESQRILGQILDNKTSSGMEVLDYVSGKYPFSEREWSRMVDGKRTGKIVTSFDYEHKVKVLNASTNIARNTPIARMEAGGSGKVLVVEAMAIVLSEASLEQRQTMVDSLRAIEDSEKRSNLTKQYLACVGEKWSPAQPRDEGGRWSSGGGGAMMAPDTGGSFGGGGGGGGVTQPSEATTKVVSKATKGLKKLEEADSQRVLGNILESKDSGMDVLDFVSNSYPFTERQQSTMVDGKRTGKIMGKTDYENKVKVLKASCNFARKSPMARFEARNPGKGFDSDYR